MKTSSETKLKAMPMVQKETETAKHLKSYKPKKLRSTSMLRSPSNLRQPRSRSTTTLTCPTGIGANGASWDAPSVNNADEDSRREKEPARLQ